MEKYFERYTKQSPLLSLKIQKKIFGMIIGVVGVSGIGSHFIMLSLLMGIRHIIMIDPAPRIEPKHCNRLIFAEELFLGKPKVEAAQSFIKRWNPSVKSTALQQDVESSDAQKALSQVSLICACTDNPAADSMLQEFAFKEQKTLLLLKQGGAVSKPGDIRFCGSSAALYVPDRGPCLFHICLDEVPMPQSEVSIALNGFVASALGWELLLGWLRKTKEAHNFIIYDAVKPDLKAYRVQPNPDCPFCKSQERKKI